MSSSTPPAIRAATPRPTKTAPAGWRRRRGRAGVGHLVYVSIVGIDRIPFPYYARKLAAERALQASGQPYSILRATQFHSFVDFLLRRSAGAAPLVMPLPAGYHMQSVDIGDVAERLLRAIADGPRGLLPDYGGPERLTVREAARLWKEARGVRKPICRFPGSAPRRRRSGLVTTRFRPIHHPRIAAA